MAGSRANPQGRATADVDLRRDAELLIPERPRSGDSTGLVELVKLLIVCHTGAERRAVALRYFHGLSFDQVGRRMGLAANRVEEIVTGVAARLKAAETHAVQLRAWPGQR